MSKQTVISRAGRTPRTKAKETRERILDAALDLFRRRGFQHTTMRQVAREAGMAVGAAYYYFHSKEALVMAFYERAQDVLGPQVERALIEHKTLEQRLRAILEVKFNYFQADRRLLGALSAHTDPRNPLSPFSAETRAIREADINYFARAFKGADIRVASDLRTHLPKVLWMYQMGLLLYWVYDDSPDQSRTNQLLEKSLSIIVRLIKFSSFSLMRPVRRGVVDLLETIYGEDTPAKTARTA